MGQYFKVINIDKKEGYSPSKFGSGNKLTEFAYEYNPFVEYIQDLLANSWLGERIAFVGDYYFEEDKYEEQKVIFGIYQKIDTKYNSQLENYKPVFNQRFLINLDKKEYIDLDKNRLKMKDYNDGYIFSPLVMLTALGNGKGGGDYRGTDENRIGNWAFDRLMIGNNENDIKNLTEIEVKFIEKL